MLLIEFWWNNREWCTSILILHRLAWGERYSIFLIACTSQTICQTPLIRFSLKPAGIKHLFVLAHLNLNLIGLMGVVHHLFTCYWLAQRGGFRRRVYCCLVLMNICSVDPSNDSAVRLKCLLLQISQSISIFHKLQRTRAHFYFSRPHVRLCCLSVCVESFVRVSNEIIVTIFTMSGGVGAMGLGEALENRVRPLVEGGALKGLEGADGQTRERKWRKRTMERGKAS